MAKMTTFCTIIAVAASHSWSIYQMDVKNAFLNGDMLEAVNTKPPDGLVVPSGNTVCQLHQFKASHKSIVRKIL